MSHPASSPPPGQDKAKELAEEVEMKEGSGDEGSSPASSSSNVSPSSTSSDSSAGSASKKRRRDNEETAEGEEGEKADLPAAADEDGKKTKRLKTVPEEEAKGAGKGKKTSTAAEEQPVDEEGSPPVHRLLQGIVEPLSDLKKSLRTGSTAVSSLLGAISGGQASAGGSATGKSPGSYQLYIWGKLVTQQPKNMPMSVSLSGPSFSIGGNSRCSLTISDPGIGSSVVCKLQNSFSSGAVHIEGQTSRNILFVNLKPIKKGVKQQLKTGDEISIITKQQTYSFTFQKVRSPSTKHANPSGAAIPTLPSVSIITSTSDNPPPFLADIFGFPTLPSAPAAPTSSQSSASSSSTSSSSSSSSSSTSGQAPAESSEASQANQAGFFSVPVSITVRAPDPRRRPATRRVSTPGTAGKGLTVKAGGDIMDHSPITLASRGLGIPPAIEALLASACPPSSSSSGTSTAATLAAQKKTAKEELAKSLLKWQDITTTFDDFPYFLDNDTKEILLGSAFVSLKKPELVKHITDIPSISRRILLNGPPGSEIYQETLVKALAHHLQVNLLIFEGFKPYESPSKASPNAAAASASNSSTSQGEAKETITAAQASTSGKPDQSKTSTDEATTGEVKDDSAPALEPTILTTTLTDLLASHSNDAAEHMDDIDNEEEDEEGMETDDLDSVFDDLDADEDDSEVDDEDSDAWYGRRPDIIKSRRGHGPFGRGGIYYGDSVHTPKTPEDREALQYDKANIEALFEFVAADENQPCILYLKDPEKGILTSYERYTYLKRQLDKISGPVVVIGSSISSSKGKGDKGAPGGFLLSKAGGQTTLLDFALFDHISRIEDRSRETSKAARVLARLLPNKIVINPPKEGPEVPKWTKQIAKDQQDMKQLQNKAAIKKVLDKNNLAIIEGEDALRSRPLREQVFAAEKIEKIVGWAVGYHLTNSEQKGQEVRLEGNKLYLPAAALDHSIRMINRLQPLAKKTSLKDVQTDNDFERKLLAEVIPPNELGVRFEDIGALDKVKNTLKELVMLPLQRPELFRKGNLTKPCKGILLFGPPGTGKTMLAKAVATESGANFINCSMSSIGSKWFGEGEKYARAVFTLASKISPCVVFIDEVDSILGSREKSGEHEAMRKIKNEFMSMWDGLKTKENERVIVMAATNRPFDLDDAVLRRMPRRLLVDLPDSENRQKILRVILSKEELEEGFDFKAVGDMTEGFSGSDLKNLCISAAYMPIREILEKEKSEGKEIELTRKKGKEKMDTDEDEEDEVEPEERETPKIRPLGMEDFVKAKKEHSASVHEDARAVGELRKWNEMYGEGGNARGKDLSYFL